MGCSGTPANTDQAWLQERQEHPGHLRDQHVSRRLLGRPGLRLVLGVMTDHRIRRIAMVRTHQPDQTDFGAIPPWNIDRKPFQPAIRVNSDVTKRSTRKKQEFRACRLSGDGEDYAAPGIDAIARFIPTGENIDRWAPPPTRPHRA